MLAPWSVHILTEVKLKRVPPWLSRQLKNYKHLYPSLMQGVRTAQAGVIICLHQDGVSLADEPLQRTLPADTDGYMAQVDVCLPDSRPLSIRGVSERI